MAGVDDNFKEDRHSRSGCVIPKSEKKYGYVTKKLISNTSLDDVPEDHTGLKPNLDDHPIEYSLNKKGRWNLLDEVRNDITKFNEDAEDLKVSALEKDTAFFGRRPQAFYGRRPKANTKAYHSVDEHVDDQNSFENERISHRFSAQTYAVERTLVEKPKPKKIKNKGRRRRSTSVDDENLVGALEPNDNGCHHVRYEIVTPCPSVSLYEKSKNQHYKHADKKPKQTRTGYPALQRRGANNFYDDWEVDDDGVIDDDYWQDLMNAVNDDISEMSVASCEESRPSSLTSVADFIEPSEKPKQQKKLRRKRNYASDSDLTVEKNGRILKYHETDDGDDDDDSDIDEDEEMVQITNENVVLPVVRSELSTLSNFTMIPIETICRSDNLTVEFLQENYGCTYYECACLPRRLCIDISGNVRKVLHNFHPLASTFDIQAICIFEVIPAQFLPVEPQNETSQIRVWLNCIFANDIESFALGTLNPCESHTIENIIESAAKMFTTLPVESFITKEINTFPTTLNRFFDAPVRLLENQVPHCMKVTEATDVVLQKEDLARKLQRQITAVQSYVWSDIGENSCGICYEWPVENNGFCLASCQHWFCNSCWRTYCSGRIRNGLIPVKCPDSNCDMIMDYDILTTVLSLPQCILFANQYRDRYVGANAANWIWCPNIKCGRIIFFENLRSSSVCACVCGELWCAHCNGAVHWPANCEHAAQYLADLKRNGDFSGTITYGKIKFVEVRKCPHCYLPMEKGPGCNHMTCRCGESFCWDCGKKWNVTGHNNCKKVATSEKVKLIDHRSAKGHEFWSDELYERCVAHRQALEAQKLKKLKTLLLASIRSPKHLNKHLNVNEKLSSNYDDIRDFVASFFEHYYQCHYLLEYTYLWCQWLMNKKERLAARRIFSLADRLNFTISRLADVCVVGNLAKIIETLQPSKKLLKYLVDEINSLQALRSVKELS